MTSLLQNLHYAVRTLLRTPAFTAVALVTLALGIGANTAIFSVVNGVLLRPLPYRQAEKLIQLERGYKDGRSTAVSIPKFVFWRDHSAGVFSAVTAYEVVSSGFNMAGDGPPERIAGSRVTRDFFDAFGRRPEIGRGFLPEEDRPGGARVAVISHELWARRFGADRGLVGRAVVLNGEPYTVVGIMPAGFHFPSSADLWAPLGLDPASREKANYLEVTARLKDGVSRQQAAAAMTVAARQYRALRLDDMDETETCALQPLQERLYGRLRPALLVAVASVLGIACVNVANLQLARVATRRREVAVRTALGAGAGRIFGQPAGAELQRPYSHGPRLQARGRADRQALAAGIALRRPQRPGALQPGGDRADRRRSRRAAGGDRLHAAPGAGAGPAVHGGGEMARRRQPGGRRRRAIPGVDARVLSGAEHSPGARPLSRRQRPAGRRAGGGDQRDAGPALLPETGPSGPAPPSRHADDSRACRLKPAPHRGCGQGRAGVGAGRSGATRSLRSHRADPGAGRGPPGPAASGLSRGAGRRLAGRADPPDPEADLGRGPAAAGLARRADDGRRRALPGLPPFQHRAAGLARPAGAGALVGGNLRRALVSGGPADAGDRHPHGPRRHRPARAADGDRPGARAGALRRRRGPARRFRPHPAARQPSRGSECQGPRHLHPGAGRAHRRGPAGERHPAHRASQLDPLVALRAE